MSTPSLDSGSFRDREGRVFFHQGEVYRALSKNALEEWRAFSQSRLFERASKRGKIVGTEEVELPAGVLERVGAEGASGQWSGALRHDRIPFLSYPYEWTFHMLRDAALLQLDLLAGALAEDMVLKDSTAYNVQFQGARPVFIDIASFERLQPGEPWVGYLQFCQLFLYPLLMSAHRGLPFQPWLRGSIDGIRPAEANDLFSFRDRFRSGVFTHVYLQAKFLEKNAKAAETKSVKDDLKKAGFKKELILANVRGLKKTLGKLSWDQGISEWGDYAGDNSYDRENRRIKEEFVHQAASQKSWDLAWDLGANTGHFSRIVAEHADQVVAFDGDLLAVDRLYRELKKDGQPKNILPLYSNLADTSPALGWRNRERQALGERPTPGFTLCLALIHHMVISANIPLPEFLDWLGSLDTHLVIEFVTKDDAMVRKLLRNKEDIYHDYEVDVFEAHLARHFETLDQRSYHGDTRRLYFARPLGS